MSAPRMPRGARRADADAPPVRGYRAGAFAAVLIAAAPWMAAAQEVSGTMTSRYDQRRTGSEVSGSDVEQTTSRLSGWLSQGNRVSLQAETTRQNSDGQHFPDLRSGLTGMMNGSWYTFDLRHSWFDNRNYREGDARLKFRDWSSLLDLRPRHAPPVTISWSRNTSQDDLVSHDVDSQYTTWRVQSSYRVGIFQLEGYHLETESIDRVTGVSVFALSTNATHIAIDSSGYIYAVDAGNQRIVKFSPSGREMLDWGNPGAGNGEFNNPRGVAVDGAGNVYVSDSGNHRVQKFDTYGLYLAQWGSFGAGAGQFNTPAGLAADGGGIYVVDSGNGRVQKFDTSGNFLLSWGSPGAGLGQFTTPEGIASNGVNVFVADRGNNRVQRFDTTGGGAFAWGSAGAGPGQFLSPMGVAVDAGGIVYVTDGTNNRVQRFTSAGGFLGQWGSAGVGDGQFNLPFGIFTDPTPRVHVVDSLNGRVQIFTDTGTFVRSYGSTATPLPAEERTGRQDHLGVEIQDSLWDLVQMNAGYGAFRSESEDPADPTTDSGSLRQTPHVDLSAEPLQGIQLTAGWNMDRIDSETATDSSRRTTQDQRAGVCLKPLTAVTANLGVSRSLLESSDAPPSRSDTLSASLNLLPLRAAPLTVGWSRTSAFVDNEGVSRGTTLSGTGGLEFRQGINARWTLAQTWTEDLVGGSRGTGRGGSLDFYLVPVPRVTGYLHFDTLQSETEGSTGTVLSLAHNLNATAGWQMGQIASMDATTGWAWSESDPGDVTRRWTLGSQMHFRWPRTSLSVFFQRAEDDADITASFGSRSTVRLSSHVTLGGSWQYQLTGPQQDDMAWSIEMSITF